MKREKFMYYLWVMQTITFGFVLIMSVIIFLVSNKAILKAIYSVIIIMDSLFLPVLVIYVMKFKEIRPKEMAINNVLKNDNNYKKYIHYVYILGLFILLSDILSVILGHYYIPILVLAISMPVMVTIYYKIFVIILRELHLLNKTS